MREKEADMLALGIVTGIFVTLITIGILGATGSFEKSQYEQCLENYAEKYCKTKNCEIIYSDKTNFKVRYNNLRKDNTEYLDYLPKEKTICKQQKNCKKQKDC